MYHVECKISILQPDGVGQWSGFVVLSNQDLTLLIDAVCRIKGITKESKNFEIFVPLW